MHVDLNDWERGYLAALVRDDIDVVKDYNVTELCLLLDNLHALREKLSVVLTKGEVK